MPVAYTVSRAVLEDRILRGKPNHAPAIIGIRREDVPAERVIPMIDNLARIGRKAKEHQDEEV